MELNELQQLIAKLETSGLRSLELSRPGERVKLTMSENNEALVVNNQDTNELFAAQSNPESEQTRTTVLTESAGVFLATHPMRSKPLACVGDSVKKNDVLGLLKIGQVYAPLTAPADGVVTKILASDGALLGFGVPALEMIPVAESTH